MIKPLIIFTWPSCFSETLFLNALSFCFFFKLIQTLKINSTEPKARTLVKAWMWMVLCYTVCFMVVFQELPAAVVGKSDATDPSCCWPTFTFNYWCKCYATVCILFTNSLHFHKSCNLHIKNMFFFNSRHSLWLH